MFAHFEADNGIDDSCNGNKLTKIYKQNPVCQSYHCYYIGSELNDVIQSGYYSSNLEYDIIGWFLDGVLTLENKKAFYFTSTRKDIIMF